MMDLLLVNLQIGLDFIADSWDGGKAYVKIDDKICWEKNNIRNRRSKILAPTLFDSTLRATCRFTASKIC